MDATKKTGERERQRAQIAGLLSQSPQLSNHEIAKTLGVTRAAAASVRALLYPAPPAPTPRTRLQRAAATIGRIFTGIGTGIGIMIWLAVGLVVVGLLVLPFLLGDWHVTTGGLTVVMLFLIWSQLDRLNSHR
jgi:hypothetical protein